MPCNDPLRLPCFMCSRGVQRVVGLVCRCVYTILVISEVMCVYPRCGEMTLPNVEKKSHSDTMFWCRWLAIINNTWTRNLSNQEVSLFTFKGAKPTEPASLSWGRFVPVFYGAIYIITIYIYIDSSEHKNQNNVKKKSKCEVTFYFKAS